MNIALRYWSWGLLSERSKNMLYRTLKRMIERGQTDGIAEKIDIFFAAGKLTEEQYMELTAMLPKKES